MGRFTLDVSKFIDKTIRKDESRANLIMRKIAIDTVKKIRMKTPFDTGDLRGSWTAAIGGAPTTFSGDDSAKNAVRIGQDFYFATDKSYAPTIEYGLYPQPGGSKTINGFSTQAPQGVVRITVQEMLAWLENVAPRFS